MDAVIEELWLTRNDCHRQASRLEAQHGIPEHEPPIGGLGMCYNWVTLTLEHVNWYGELWARMSEPNGPVLKKLRSENGERIMSAGKSLFVFSLSSLEYSVKEAAQRYPGALAVDFQKRQYLASLMGKSHGAGLIDRADKERWDCLSKLRNALVHNNGVADEDLVVTFPTGATATMVKGSMTQGNLKTFPKLVRWAVGAYADWCDAFLKRSV